MTRDCMSAAPAGRDMELLEREDGIDLCWILLPVVLTMFLALCKVSAWASEEFHLGSPGGGGRGMWDRALDAGTPPPLGPEGADRTAIDLLALADAAWLDGVFLTMEHGLIACSTRAQRVLRGLEFSRDGGGSDGSRARLSGTDIALSRSMGVASEVPASGASSDTMQAYFDVQLLVRTLCELPLLAMP